MKILPVP